MGNVEGAIVRNVDKRTSRREHHAIFEASVARFRQAPFAAPFTQPEAGERDERFMRVCVRKRPIFDHELKEHEFDVVTCLEGRVVVHDARMQADMIQMYTNHHDFIFDGAFGEEAGNREVYEGTAARHVEAALKGENGTVMMYGQTGSGKTYTMRSIYEHASTDLFEQAGACHITVMFVELLGDTCFDMLNQGTPCSLATAADGAVHPFPSVEVHVSSAAELMALIELATKLRATAATGVHDQSSRSHALCRIFVQRACTEGSLTLVDLAGSEHRIDNAEHNAERRKEGAKINASLCALKDCVRAAAANAKFIAFRQNRLTQMLRGCFVGAEHRTVIIATVSPSSKDTEHSLNTLRHACLMDGQNETKAENSSHMVGGFVTKEALGRVDVTKIARERKSLKQKGEPPPEWTKPAAPEHQKKSSNTAARAVLDRRCMQALSPELREALVGARQEFGSARQRARLMRAGPVPCETDENDRRARKDGKRRSSARGDRGSSLEPGGVAERERSVEPNCGTGSPGVALTPDAEHGRAQELLRLFTEGGRDVCEWRKNDLRLLNNYLPLVYGDVQIQWTHPNVALDELERIVEIRCTPVSAQDLQGEGSQRDDGTPHDPGQRESSPAEQRGYVQNLSSPELLVDPDGHEGVSHQDAIRARRSAIEQARKEALNKAMSKKQGGNEVSDIASLEKQLASRQLSAAAAVGVKKRLAALKAVAIREERTAAAKVRASEAAAIAEVREPVSQDSQSFQSPTKNPHLCPADEMAAIEKQLAGVQLSAASQSGLKKRLASLKGNVLREERAAAAHLKAKALAEEQKAAAAAASAAAAAAAAAVEAAAVAAAQHAQLHAQAQEASIAARDEEMLSLQEQLQSGGLRHADAVSMRKRLATLKAAVIRDQRIAASKNRASDGGQNTAPDPSPTANRASPEHYQETVPESCEDRVYLTTLTTSAVPGNVAEDASLLCAQVAQARAPAVALASRNANQVDATAVMRDEEAVHLQDQLDTGGLRHADVISIKRRLATLKAAAIRDQRVAASKNRTPTWAERSPGSQSSVQDPDTRPLPKPPAVHPDFLPDPAVPPSRVEQQDAFVPEQRTFERDSICLGPRRSSAPGSRQKSSIAHPRCGVVLHPEEDYWQPPFKPGVSSVGSAPTTASSGPPYTQAFMYPSCHPAGTERVSRRGAAAAPWANGWSNEVVQ